MQLIQKVFCVIIWFTNLLFKTAQDLVLQWATIFQRDLFCYYNAGWRMLYWVACPKLLCYISHTSILKDAHYCPEYNNIVNGRAFYEVGLLCKFNAKNFKLCNEILSLLCTVHLLLLPKKTGIKIIFHIIRNMKPKLSKCKKMEGEKMNLKIKIFLNPSCLQVDIISHLVNKCTWPVQGH